MFLFMSMKKDERSRIQGFRLIWPLTVIIGLAGCATEHESTGGADSNMNAPAKSGQGTMDPAYYQSSDNPFHAD
jgi:hypothetical protein